MSFQHGYRAALAAVVLLFGLPAPAAAAAQELTYKLILKHGIVGTQKMGTMVVKVTSRISPERGNARQRVKEHSVCTTRR